ncbi:hypothetical protein D3C76_1399380 [compost metagenome]
MLQDTSHVIAGIDAQAQLVLFLIECIVGTLKKGLVTVHAGAVHPEKRLGHKGGVQAMLAGNGLHH